MRSTPRPARPASLLRRTGRQLRWALGTRHAPLVRAVDRARARTWLLAVLGGLVALVLATGGALLDYRTAAPRADADRGRLHQVDAVVRTVPDKASAGSRYAGGYDTRMDVQASWTGPDGSPHTGTVEAPRSATAGSVVPVWIGPDGAATGAPADHAALAVAAGCTGAGAFLALLALLVVAVRVRLHRLDRRAEEAWGRAWERLEPRWSGRAGHRREE
ncbi:hypothetical protein [Kitasatospora sp. NPDC097643]|uniref:Rv1733c family protein n=1 Tax=Kitasatospora sp. NPDC097643 TaxID=3157230 RepID=UPI0033228A41